MEGRIFKALQKMEEIRGQNPVFEPDAETYTRDMGDPRILCIVRKWKDRMLTGIFNFSDSPKQAALPEKKGVCKDLLRNKKLEKELIFLWIISI